MQILDRKDIRNLCLLFVLGVVLFGTGLGSYGLLDPDEPFYSLTAKEMLARHDWSTPYLFGAPQFEKPILSYWIFCLFFNFFGVNELSARLGPCLAGIVLVLATYVWGRILFYKRFIAFVAALILATSAEYIILSRLVLTDMFLALFTTLTWASFSLALRFPKRKRVFWIGIFVFSSLGFLTKGPLGVLIPLSGILMYAQLNKKEQPLRGLPWAIGLLIFLTLGFSWYAWTEWKQGGGFLAHFFIHENIRRFFFAEHRNYDNVFFYIFNLLVGLFPWSVFLPGAFYYLVRESFRTKTALRKAWLFLAVAIMPSFIFFTLAKSKLPSYIFPLFPAVAMVLAAWIYRVCRSIHLGYRVNLVFFIFMGIGFALVPPGLAIATFSYAHSQHLNVELPLVVMSLFFVPLFWAAFWSFIKKRLRRMFIFITAAMTIFAVFSFCWLVPSAENNLSSKHAALYFEKREGEERFFIASKLFARGVAYYTEKPVSVLIENPRKAFYTKHPIPIVSKREDLVAIPRELYPVYGVLRKKEMRVLEKIATDGLSFEILSREAGRYLVKIERQNV